MPVGIDAIIRASHASSPSTNGLLEVLAQPVRQEISTFAERHVLGRLHFLPSMLTLTYRLPKRKGAELSRGLP
jgi:hypothetical protein